jgi:hypothetical protein
MWIVETLQNTTMTMALLEKEIRLETLMVSQKVTFHFWRGFSIRF